MNIKSYHPGRILLFFSILLMISSTHSKQLYNMADLEILKSENNYREFFAHARDLKPRERTKHWSEMVRSMSVDFIDQQLKFRNYKMETIELVESLSLWPLLRTDEFYQTKRNRYHLTVLKHCLLNNHFEVCHKQISDFWPKSNRDPETGHRIAELIHSIRPKMDLWHFLSDVAIHPLSGFYCEKDMVVEKMIQHYFLEIDEQESNKKISARIDMEIHANCWAKAQLQLKKFIFQGPEYYRPLVYRMLKSKDSLDQGMEDNFLTYYLLESPTPGHVFNRAWNNLKSMTDDPLRRQQVLSFLRRQDPLPGSIFATSDLSMRQTITKLFNENFSEYLSLYAKTCLSYLSGTKTFPNGNPTVQCDEFFASNKNQNWVGQTLQMKYSAIKK